MKLTAVLAFLTIPLFAGGFQNDSPNENTIKVQQKLWADCEHRRMDLSDPVLAPFSSMYRADRTGTGLGPIPAHGDCELWWHCSKTRGYQASLIIIGRTFRELLFDYAGDKYVLGYEIERYLGPGNFTPGHQVLKERVVISYNYQTHEGEAHYLGGKDRQVLTIDQALARVKSWGY